MGTLIFCLPCNVDFSKGTSFYWGPGRICPFEMNALSRISPSPFPSKTWIICISQAVYRYLLCALVCMALCVIVTHKTNSRFEAKMARQLFNLANIKHRFLSNDGNSVRFLNRFGKFIRSLNRISEMFFFTWCLVDKFSPRIHAYHSGSWRFIANKLLLKMSE